MRADAAPEGIRKEERASRFYQSLSKYRRLDAAADFVHVAWALNAPLFAQAQALPNKADVVFAVDAAGGPYILSANSTFASRSAVMN